MDCFSERLKELRKEEGLSIAKLSEKVGIGVASISRWENNLSLANYEQVVALAKFFKVSTDYLLGLED